MEDIESGFYYFLEMIYWFFGLGQGKTKTNTPTYTMEKTTTVKRNQSNTEFPRKSHHERVFSFVCFHRVVTET